VVVILSGVRISRSEVLAQSKDSFQPALQRSPGGVLTADARELPCGPEGVRAERDPSTSQLLSLRESNCFAQDDNGRLDAELNL
jgi:hypothetical protein